MVAGSQLKYKMQSVITLGIQIRLCEWGFLVKENDVTQDNRGKTRVCGGNGEN